MKFEHVDNNLVFNLFKHVISLSCNFGHFMVSRVHFHAVCEFKRKLRFRNYKIYNLAIKSHCIGNILKLIKLDHNGFEREGLQNLQM